MMKVDGCHRHHHARARGNPRIDIGTGKPVEQNEAQRDARTVEPNHMIGHAVTVLWPRQLIFDMEDDHDREVLDAVKDGGPDESLHGWKNEPPNPIREEHERTDEWHGSTLAPPDSQKKERDCRERKARHVEPELI